MSKYRRKRRTRPGSERSLVVKHLTDYIWKDSRTFQAVMQDTKESSNIAFGRILNKWLDSSRESVIDRYVDDAAYAIAWHAINTVKKQINDQKEDR